MAAAGFLRRLALILAAGFGAGYVPNAPGTAGSVVGALLALGIYHLGSTLALVLATVAISILAIWSAGVAEEHHGVHDSPHIVVDEIAGQMVALLAVPATWLNVLVAFGWFRLCDSYKPWPAGKIDREWTTGLGVVLDDLVAGVYAAVATGLMVHLGIVEWVRTWVLRLL